MTFVDYTQTIMLPWLNRLLICIIKPNFWILGLKLTSIQGEMRSSPLSFGGGEQVTFSQQRCRVETCRLVGFICDLWAMFGRDRTSRIFIGVHNRYPYLHDVDIHNPHEAAYVQNTSQTSDLILIVLDTTMVASFLVSTTYCILNNPLDIIRSCVLVPLMLFNF